ncbi:MAG: hypothetical protein CUN55_08300 [Phototrophicales bacterium]|nr:MAG: hypothetical protein CUN55_08300 [Phototrophicales bacterium]
MTSESINLTPRAKRITDSILFVVCALNVLVFVFAAIQMNAIGFPLDDSWIHQTYARNLGLYGEWAFIRGETSAASTAPLYSALLAIGHAIGLSPYVWAHTLGILSLFAAAAVSVRLARRLFPTTPFIGLGTGLIIATSWHLVWAAASGMETMQFMALSLAIIAYTWHEIDPLKHPHQPQRLFGRGAWVGFLGALLYLTRPEGIGLVGLAGLLVLLSGAHSTRKSYLWWASGVVIGFMMIVIPFSALNYALTGRILPTTAQAKIAEQAALREEFIGIRYFKLLLTISAGAQFLWYPMIIIGIWLVWRRFDSSKRWLLMLPLVWAFAHLTLYAWRLPAPYQHGRYVMPILPPLFLFGYGGMYYMVDVAKERMLPRVFSRVLALSAILAIFGFLYIGATTGYGRDVRIINTEMVKTAKWISENLPDDELLAVHDIGAVGYYAPRPILDLAGLITPEIVPIILDPEALMEFICERDAQWMMVFPEQRPAPADDPRLEEVYRTNEPYTLEAGRAGNMTVYRLHFDENCQAP